MASESNPTSTTESVDVNAYVARAEEFLREDASLNPAGVERSWGARQSGGGRLETPDVVIQFEGRDEDLRLKTRGSCSRRWSIWSRR